MKTRTLVAIVLMSITAGGVAGAGRKVPWPVNVDLVNRVANGALGSTRNSPDSISQIGCSVHYDAVNRRNNLNCSATDAAGRSMSCASQQPELVQIALGINGDSYVEIRWDRERTCTNLLVDNSSIHEPKS